MSTISSAARLAAGDLITVEVRYYEGGSRIFASLTMAVRYHGSGSFAMEEWKTERTPVELSELETRA